MDKMRMLKNVHSSENRSFANIVFGLLDMPWTGNDFFCIYDSGTWYEHTNKPHFFHDSDEIINAFVENYCSSITK